jgi:hypothetical protein
MENDRKVLLDEIAPKKTVRESGISARLELSVVKMDVGKF